MNRYALGGAIGLLMLLALSGMGGLGRLLQGNGQGRGDVAADDSLGTLPIEQAGQVVQRQSDPTSGMPAMGTNLLGTPAAPMNGGFTAPAGTPPTLSPTQPQNVIPRQGVTTLPAQVGDIAPVQPGLVQPNPVPPVTDDPELESIPALW